MSISEIVAAGESRVNMDIDGKTTVEARVRSVSKHRAYPGSGVDFPLEVFGQNRISGYHVWRVEGSD